MVLVKANEVLDEDGAVTQCCGSCGGTGYGDIAR